MPDREKVIKGLEVCFDSSKECNGCPYIATPYCKTTLLNDVTVLLKEQEALAVREDKVNKCVCGNEINRYWHPEYCGFCGKKLVWY